MDDTQDDSAASKAYVNDEKNQDKEEEEEDHQDPSVKSFIPFSKFFEAGCHMMKNDDDYDSSSVVKSGKSAEVFGVEQKYSRIEDLSANINVVGDGDGKANNNSTTSLSALFSIDQHISRDSISASGHLTVPPPASSCFDNMSFRSNSTTSTRSFAFPILTSDWNDSPVRMADGDRRRFSKKSRHWAMCFGCYNF